MGGGTSCGLRGLSVDQLYWGNWSKISPPGSAFRCPVLGDPVWLHEEIELSIYTRAALGRLPQALSQQAWGRQAAGRCGWPLKVG